MLLGVRLPVLFDDALAHVGDVGDIPHALFTGNAPEIDRAVSESWCRLRRPGRTASAARRLGAEESCKQSCDHRTEKHATQEVTHVYVSPTQSDESLKQISAAAEFRSGSTRRTVACRLPRR